MDFIDYLNDDERLFINKALEDKLLSTFSKSEMLEDLEFYHAVTAIDEYKKDYESIIKMIQNLTDDEWEYLKKRYPLFVRYDYDFNDEEDFCDYDDKF